MRSLILALLAAVYAVSQTGCAPETTQAAPAPVPVMAAEQSDVAAALDRIARSNEAQTAVLRDLSRTMDSLQTRVALLEQGKGPAPEPDQEPDEPKAAAPATERDNCKHCRRTVLWEKRDGRWFFTHGQHFNQLLANPTRAAAVQYVRRGLFGRLFVRRDGSGPLGGRVLPAVRGFFGRLARPFGGRLLCR